jgi:SAM-dependent methyltransferase
MNKMKKLTKEEWFEIYKDCKKGHIWPLETVCEDTYGQIKMVIDKGFLREDDRILDIGSGNARVAMALSSYNIKEYVGIEPIKESVEFSKNILKEQNKFRFMWISIFNEFYNPGGNILAKDFRIPLGDDHFDLTILASVFSHITKKVEIMNYLKEIYRVLKPSGRLVCSYFKSPPNEANFLDDAQEVNLSEGKKLAERVVFPEKEFMRMLKPYFSVLYKEGGETTEYHDQCVLYCKKQ